MLYHTATFGIYFAVFFIVYWALFAKSTSKRSAFILIASYVFYGWWDWRFLGLIALSSGADYFIGKGLANSIDGSRRKQLLWVSIAINIGLLAAFKYYNFFIDSLDGLLDLIEVDVSALRLDIILPVGISFYTFQTLSYTLDIYHRRMQPCSHWLHFFAFVAFFPQLIAGPIERARDLLPQFEQAKQFNLDQARIGILQFGWGLLKKLVVADRLALIVDAGFGQPSGLSTQEHWIVLLAFAGQLYLDFSAYSDMAIGLSRLLGFQLSTNFKRPYFVSSFSNFWTRWHITLSSWFRDYVYIPLGGSRVGNTRHVMNVMVVFLISGLWHGAAWGFVVWGAINAFFLILMDPLIARLPNRWWSRVFVPVWVTLCWTLSLAFFRGESWQNALEMIRGALGTGAVTASGRWTENPSELIWVAALATPLFLIELITEIQPRWQWLPASKNRFIRWSALTAIAACITLLGLYGLDMDNKAFIYFQF